jgi:hypothetical protein
MSKDLQPRERGRRPDPGRGTTRRACFTRVESFARSLVFSCTVASLHLVPRESAR